MNQDKAPDADQLSALLESLSKQGCMPKGRELYDLVFHSTKQWHGRRQRSCRSGSLKVNKQTRRAIVAGLRQLPHREAQDAINTYKQDCKREDCCVRKERSRKGRRQQQRYHHHHHHHHHQQRVPSAEQQSAPNANAHGLVSALQRQMQDLREQVARLSDEVKAQQQHIRQQQQSLAQLNPKVSALSHALFHEKQQQHQHQPFPEELAQAIPPDLRCTWSPALEHSATLTDSDHRELGEQDMLQLQNGSPDQCEPPRLLQGDNIINGLTEPSSPTTDEGGLFFDLPDPDDPFFGPDSS